ncbi:MAG: hypothetical protein NTZ83_03370 [Candidatus Pacearchaeota archaeon]|nr:hypothetical protein [Candidatus Pacearchaeota archaeon]
MKNKKKTKEKEHGKRTIALSQILILVIATIAFSWMVGSEVKTVSAAPSATEISACNNQRFCLNGKIYAGHLIGDPSTCVGDTLLELQTCPSGQCLPDGSQCFVDTADPKTPSKIGNWAGNIAGGVIGGTLTPLLTEQTRRLFKIGTSSKISPINTPTTSIPPLGSTAPLGPNQLAPGPTTMPKTSTWDKVIGNHLLRRIFYNAAWAAVTATVITYFAKQWASPRNAGDIAIVAWVGGGIGVVIGTLVTTAWWSGPIAAAIVILATAIYMLVGYQIYSREIFTFRVGLWQPTSIGSECNKCNSLTIGGENACSEYICHSYGTACEWVNGETQYEACIEVGRGDVAAPGIKPVKEVYGENVFPIVDNANYDYTTNSAGAKIIYKGEGAGTGQCVPAFTSVTLAVNTSEYAHCKIGLEPSTGATNAEKFGKMKDMAEGTSYTINHTVKLSSSVAADQASLEAAGYELTNGGVFRMSEETLILLII